MENSLPEGQDDTSPDTQDSVTEVDFLSNPIQWIKNLCSEYTAWVIGGFFTLFGGWWWYKQKSFALERSHKPGVFEKAVKNWEVTAGVSILGTAAVVGGVAKCASGKDKKSESSSQEKSKGQKSEEASQRAKKSQRQSKAKEKKSVFQRYWKLILVVVVLLLIGAMFVAYYAIMWMKPTKPIIKRKFHIPPALQLARRYNKFKRRRNEADEQPV